MAVLRALLRLAAAVMFIPLSLAANYTVGGSNGGWDTSTNLQSWASSQSFLVGDNLIFKYAASHDVVEVSKSDYDSCQTTSALQSFSDGDTVIPLTSPGKRYFICGTPGHCNQGMKVEITTLATSSPQTSVSPATSPAATPLSPASPPASPETPSSSPAPEISPTSPAQLPESPPTLSPKSSSDSPLSSLPAPSSDIPSTSPPPGGSSPQLPPSSATKCGFKTTITVGFSLGFLVLTCL